MIYQTPAGARDLLPLEVEQKRWINDCLQHIFQKFGYQRIVTSTLEWLDTLTAGGAIQPSKVIQLRNNGESSLGLRPELTASIARAAVTRMAGNTYPQRLCYRANVFRNPSGGHHGRQLEFYQAGVELLFAGGVLADAEIILLLSDCLRGLGISDWSILIGEAGLTRSLLSAFPESIRTEVRNCIANLDRIALESLELNAELKTSALMLFDLRGKPEDVLHRISALNLDDDARVTVNNLKSLIKLLNSSAAKPLPLTLDLSLLQTFDYYTGIVFKAVSFQDSQSYILAEGGRYDQLLGLYDPQGKSSPGIGFSMSIEDLHSCLLSTTKLPQQAPKSDCLVIPTTTEVEAIALRVARQLRSEDDSARIEIDLGERSEAAIKQYANTCRIKQLVWIEADGSSRIENLE
ncbi:ATP phosphoribosyltransferase regulatory subunit [Waterburya agarophytonicola K14]|uniref:ATP phosphoribosyltransferase regulatory subunit n=1 Tax=Waterburya agarophytonicola KI4 TaxID=2874699 RepID=A0A964FKP3_9CYAN|nr:ATP phosphoribosyltransferase regulatory subunit [Waterburya agarophytonicola]MCC0178888.1 ATP phosphoribosyltransferase regulatory subunit [Waterburya agarophytonicola KI4]